MFKAGEKVIAIKDYDDRFKEGDIFTLRLSKSGHTIETIEEPHWYVNNLKQYFKVIDKPNTKPEWL
jgi:hypothetical protein